MKTNQIITYYYFCGQSRRFISTKMNDDTPQNSEKSSATDNSAPKGNFEPDASGFSLSSSRAGVKGPTNPGPHPYDDCYNMAHPNRGIALIFNHQYFANDLYAERKGTEFDRDAMCDVLQKMGFHVEVNDDKTRDEILSILTVVSKMDHSMNDCLVIAVMSHGKANGRLLAKDREYTTSDIIDAFSGDRCPSLAGKPKLFFFQACRGEKTDPGVRIESDSGPAKNQMVYTIPAMADILIMYATVEGYYAWRDTTKGGFFIQTLAKKLGEHHKEKDLLSILTMVNREVAIGFESKSMDRDFDKKKAMCSIVSMLTRNLYFT